MKKFIFTLISVLLGAIAFNCYAATPKHKTQTVTYEVGMHCQKCVDKITDNLSFLKGVKDLRISLKEKTVTIEYDPAKIQESTFVEKIQKMGYTVTKKEPSPAPQPAPAKQ
ncbi:MAG: heavy-metal-associated domain-containing protein [Bacteroidales bacterium]|nr:heavy-metal-associated domain-containing protein [Bacteroidales bacterium]